MAALVRLRDQQRSDGKDPQVIYESALSVEELARLSELRKLLAAGTAEAMRIAGGVSRGEAARACGVDEETVARWERGTARPTTRRALEYLRLLEKLEEAMTRRRGES